MYYHGNGVTQDNVLAHVWTTFAATIGNNTTSIMTNSTMIGENASAISRNSGMITDNRNMIGVTSSGGETGASAGVGFQF